MRLLPLKDLHLRHRALRSEARARSFLEAAQFCLAMQGFTPPEEFQVQDEDESELIRVEWEPIGDDCKNSWRNDPKAIEEGACTLAIAAVELRRGLYAWEIPPRGTHVDYYLAPQDAEDLEEAWRLEVSGTVCNQAEVRKRLHQKIRQASKGKSSWPALACVVGFKVRMIMMQTIKS